MQRLLSHKYRLNFKSQNGLFDVGGTKIQKLSSETSDMTYEWLGEMFEGDSAETCTGKIPQVPMGAERRVRRARTWERGPPSAQVEFTYQLLQCGWGF